MKGIYSVLLLILSNVFMTLAWYGHLQFKKFTSLQGLGLTAVILISWAGFFEYMFQVPANKIGYRDNGGPFSLFELKTISGSSLSDRIYTDHCVFRTEKMAWNYLVGFFLIMLAVFFIFKKW